MNTSTQHIFKLARNNGTEELAYSFETEMECLALPAAEGTFIIEKGDDIPNGWRVAYFGTGNAQQGTGQWVKVTQAETQSPIITQENP